MATLIFSAVHYEHISEHKDKEGRFVMVTGKIEGIVISLLNMFFRAVTGPSINI